MKKKAFVSRYHNQASERTYVQHGQQTKHQTTKQASVRARERVSTLEYHHTAWCTRVRTAVAAIDDATIAIGVGAARRALEAIYQRLR